MIRVALITLYRFGEYAPFQSRMRSALVAETRTLLRLSGFNRIVSVFVGGGTPTPMEPDTVKVCARKNLTFILSFWSSLHRDDNLLLLLVELVATE